MELYGSKGKRSPKELYTPIEIFGKWYASGRG